VEECARTIPILGSKKYLEKKTKNHKEYLRRGSSGGSKPIRNRWDEPRREALPGRVGGTSGGDDQRLEVGRAEIERSSKEVKRVALAISDILRES